MYRGEHQSDCYTEYVMPIFCQWTYVLPRSVESDYIPCQHDAGKRRYCIHIRFPLLSRILVETFPTLPTQPPSIHHFLHQNRRPILAIPKLLMQNIHNCQTGINPDEICQLQRAHGHIRAILHNVVNVFFLTNPRF